MSYTDKELGTLRATCETDRFYAERNRNAVPAIARLVERLDAAEAALFAIYEGGHDLDGEDMALINAWFRIKEPQAAQLLPLKEIIDQDFYTPKNKKVQVK